MSTYIQTRPSFNYPYQDVDVYGQSFHLRINVIEKASNSFRIQASSEKKATDALRINTQMPEITTSSGLRVRTNISQGSSVRISVIERKGEDSGLRLHVEEEENKTSSGFRFKSNLNVASSLRASISETLYRQLGLRIHLEEESELYPYPSSPEVEHFVTSFRFKSNYNRSDKYRISVEDRKGKILGLRILVEEETEDYPYEFSPRVQHVTTAFRFKSNYNRSDSYRVSVEDTKSKVLGLRILVEEETEDYPYTLSPNVRHESWGLRIRTNTNTTSGIRTLIEDTKSRGSGLRLCVEETTDDPPYLNSPNVPHAHFGLRIRTNYNAASAYRQHIERTSSACLAGLRICVEEETETYPYPSSPSVRHASVAFRFRGLAHQTIDGLRLNIEETKKTNLGLRIQVEEETETYPYLESPQARHSSVAFRFRGQARTLASPLRVSVNETISTSFGLRILVEEQTEDYPYATSPYRHQDTGLRLQVDETKVTSTFFRVQVEQARVSVRLDPRLQVEDTKYRSFGLRFFVEETSEDYPYATSVEKHETVGLRLFARIRNREQLGFRISPYKTESVSKGLRSQIEIKENKDSSGLRLYTELPGTSTVDAARIYVDTQEYGSGSYRISPIRRVQRSNAYRFFHYRRAKTSFGLRIRVDKLIPPKPPALGLRVHVVPGVYTTRDFHIESKITVRLGKYQGYFWVAYNDGLRDQIPINWTIGPAQITFTNIADDGTETVISDVVVTPDNTGKYVVDELASFEFNKKYIMRIKVRYDGWGTYCDKYQTFEYIVRENAFYTTPPRTTLAYTFDLEELAVLVSI